MDFTLDFRPESELEFFSLKLTDDLLRKICQGQADLTNLSGVSITLSSTNSNTLTVGDHKVQLSRVNEAQPVDLLSFPKQRQRSSVRLLGSLAVKLNPKVELEASKAEAIRQRSQEAEKERTARKTVELDRIPPVTPKLIKRSRSASITSLRDFPTTITAPATSSNSISPKTPPKMYSNTVRSSTIITSAPASVKKPSTTSVKDRLNAILRKRR